MSYLVSLLCIIVIFWGLFFRILFSVLVFGLLIMYYWVVRVVLVLCSVLCVFVSLLFEGILMGLLFFLNVCFMWVFSVFSWVVVLFFVVFSFECWVLSWLNFVFWV